MSFPQLTPEQIASACLIYRHDFGLLEDGDRHRLMFTAREWERAMSHEIRAPLLAEIERLTADNANLRTVMIAAAEEISAHWDAHCDSEGYGPANLMRRLEDGIPSQYGYTAGAFAGLRADVERLTAELAAAREDAERYRWLRSKHEGEKAQSFCVFWPESDDVLEPVGCMTGELDAAIDAARGEKAQADTQRGA